MTGIVRRGKLLFWLLAVIISISLTGQTGLAAGNDEAFVSLQILSMNDYHGSLAESGKNPGAAKVTQFLADQKAHNPEGTILLAAGDMMQGSPDSNLLYGKSVIDVMNYLTFDAMTLGNHEFDWGIGVLEERIQQAAFPVLCANIIDRRTGKSPDFVKPYIIVERKGIKVAVIGVTTQETEVTTNPRVIANYAFADPASVIRYLVPQLKQQGAQVIVVLAHLGSYMNKAGIITGDGAKLVRESTGSDAIITGHSHQTVYGKVEEIPVIQASYNGRAVGMIEMVIDSQSGTVQSSEVTVLPVPNTTVPDPAMEQFLHHSLQEIEPLKKTAVGYTRYELSHDRSAPVQTVLGQFVTDGIRQTAKSDIAFCNTGGLRTSIAAGAITMGNLYEVMPFDNTLYTLDLTGKEVMEVLEYGLGNKQFGMMQYAGLTIVYDPQAPQGNRIVSVKLLNGKPLAIDKTYKVVINDFMAAGGDGFIMLQGGKNRRDTGIFLRDSLAEVIKKTKVIDFSGDNRWILRNTTTKQGKEAA